MERRTTYFLLFLGLLSLTLANRSFSDTTYVKPTYWLIAKQVSITTNELTFDLFIRHRNLSQTPFEYAGGQFFFRTTMAYKNGGYCTYKYATGASGDTISQLPINMRPRNPSMGVINGDTILMRLAINTFPGAGNGYIIPDTGTYGLRIIRMKYTNVTSTFLGYPGTNIRWQNNIPNPYTKIFAYTGIGGTVNTEITDTLYHIREFTGTGIEPNITITPTEFSLAQNYPNPFNPTTKITYAIPVEGKVTMKVYDLTGREVMNLVNQVKQVGFHTVDFNGADLASGVYFYRINVSGFEGKNYEAVRRMLLVK